ncbi:MAG: efflux RND transporter permease subunit, partial [Mariprofundaceae bacterium]|nr:efflux RND transporter permease subunit [Mariprofundaceae bacterium]
MKRLIAFFVERGLLVNMLSLMLLGGGIFAALSIQREAFPSINFDLVVINTAWPGASPREIERLIVTPIERELKGVDGINTIRSTAYPGSMSMNIEIDPDYTDRSRLVSDVQQAINRADLPNDLPDDPVLTEIKSKQTPVLSFTIFGDFKPLTLKRISDHVEDDVLNIPGVARIITQGRRKEEIRIVLDPERMRRQRVSTNDVMRLIRGWNVNAPGGSLKEAKGQKLIRVTGQFSSAEDAASLVLRANERGDALRLSDVADVYGTLDEPARYVDAMGKPAINMIVMKKGNADIINLVDRVRAYLKTIPQKYSKEMHVRTYQDYSTVTRLRLGVLTSNGGIGLLLVLFTLLLFLRPAVALTAAWGLPIIFFSGLLVLFMAGNTLNLLTMFGFIIVLGLMVDDAIIIGENATWHMEHGMEPNRAATLGTYELAGPVSATVLTTMVAFLPLMFMQGIIGKFVFSIPVVVVVLLFFSWLEALFILPNHIRDISNPRAHPRERRLLAWITSIYTRVLKLAVKLRYLTILVTIMILGGSIWLASTMTFQLFPSGGESQFYLRVTAPNGTTLEGMRKILLNMERKVRARIDPSILETTITIAGQSSANERDSLKQIGDHFGFVRVILIPFTMRNISAFTVMHQLEKSIPKLFPDLPINFVMLKPGPPIGRALEVELSGLDETGVTRAARNLVAYLSHIPGVHSIESGLTPGDPEVHIVLDRRLAAYAGVDLATVATHIKAAFDGLRVSTLNRGKQEVDVTLRYAERFHNNVRTLSHLGIPNRMGGLTELGKLAHFETRPGVTSIHHKDGNRIINVSAEVDTRKISSKALNAQVVRNKEKWLGNDMNRVNPHMGGEEERSQESLRGLIFSFAYALAGIFVILAIQFNRLSYPILVMLAIPFGAVGIIAGFFLHGQPLSFMALMGFVARTG